MALRSLVGMMKVLPRRVPGSRALATVPKPKGSSWARVAAALEDASKYGSTEEFKPIGEKFQRQTWILNKLVVLISAGCFGTLGYAVGRR